MSRTVTVKVQVLVLPLASVAVFVTVVTPTGKAEPLAGTLTKLVTLPHASLAVTLKLTLLAHWLAAALTVMLVGQVIVGPWLSRTITRCWQVVVLPLVSVAVHVTRFVPTGNCAGALLLTVTAPQLSLAVGLPNATPVAKHAPAFALTVTSAGQVIVGA